MKRAFHRVAALFSLACISVGPVRAETFESLKEAVRKKFPSVRQVSTEELAKWLADKDRVPPLLLDARREEEFAVSHLRGARNLETVEKVKTALPAGLPPIVVYCSVGYRSSALAEKLQRAGFTNVANLEGSLFQWANEGRPLHRGTNAVWEIHGYSRKWSQLLNTNVAVRF